MRKITAQAARAFLSGDNYRNSNTTVEVSPIDGTVDIYLHGNLIAHRDHVTGVIRATLAGWPTPTTRERLNGIAAMCGGVGIHQRKGEQLTDSGWPLDSRDWYIIRGAE